MPLRAATILKPPHGFAEPHFIFFIAEALGEHPLSRHHSRRRKSVAVLPGALVWLSYLAPRLGPAACVVPLVERRDVLAGRLESTAL